MERVSSDCFLAHGGREPRWDVWQRKHFPFRFKDDREHILMLTGGSQYRGNFDEAGKRIW